MLKEVLFAVHDYLHLWAYRALRALAPKDPFAPRRMTRDALEDMVFAHLVSEAPATVGLDYWYLCTLSLNEVCNLGTVMDCGLTTDYHERFAGEYRRFNPSLNVQSPEFFELFTRFYRSGVLPGFDARALRESPLLLRWLEHELRYSRLQRRYSREWFLYLTGSAKERDPATLDRPVADDAAWKLRLVAELGAMLWAKVKGDERRALPKQAGGFGLSPPPGARSTFASPTSTGSRARPPRDTRARRVIRRATAITPTRPSLASTSDAAASP